MKIKTFGNLGLVFWIYLLLNREEHVCLFAIIKCKKQCSSASGKWSVPSSGPKTMGAYSIYLNSSSIQQWNDNDIFYPTHHCHTHEYTFTYATLRNFHLSTNMHNYSTFGQTHLPLPLLFYSNSKNYTPPHNYWREHFKWIFYFIISLSTHSSAYIFYANLTQNY